MMIHLRWRHPNVGEIHEDLCPTHDSEVRSALWTLGIGCTGEVIHTVRVCTRCVMDNLGERPSVALRERPGSPL